MRKIILLAVALWCSTAQANTLTTVGWVTLGATYAGTFATTMGTTNDRNPRYSLIPLIGPFMQLDYSKSGYKPLLILSGTFQIAGALMVLIGYSQEANEKVSVAPTESGIAVSFRW